MPIQETQLLLLRWSSFATQIGRRRVKVAFCSSDEALRRSNYCCTFRDHEMTPSVHVKVEGHDTFDFLDDGLQMMFCRNHRANCFRYKEHIRHCDVEINSQIASAFPLTFRNIEKVSANCHSTLRSRAAIVIQVLKAD